MADPVKSNQKISPFARLGELFDASAMGLVTLLLLVASFVATWRGMDDFIASREGAASGAVSAGSQGLVLLIVATLSLAMYVALREMIAPYYVRGWWSAIWKRLVAGLLYAVLALWSIGFGYGFWWSLIAGQEATEAGLRRTVVSVRQETSDIRARLDAAGSVMASAQALSDLKAEQEAERGGTCGVNSPAGAGPLARARGETQTQITVLGASVRDDWQAPLSARLVKLEAELVGALASGGDLEGDARKQRFEALGQKTQSAAREIGADATARGRTLAAQLRAKADQLSHPPEGGRVTYCYDLDLAASLKAAADELGQVYTIEVVPFTFAEGADGVARAIEDLVTRVGGVVDREAGLEAGKQSIALAGRDRIALLAAIGVDLGLFVFALLRGSGGRRERHMEMVPLTANPVLLRVEEGSVKVEREMVPKLAPPVEEKQKPLPRKRLEANPKAVGIGTSASGSSSQVDQIEQVDELVESIDGIYRLHRRDSVRAQDDNEIKGLKNEITRLAAMGYHAIGSPGQLFDAAMHKVIEEQVSEKEAGTIIATVRPGFIQPNGGLFRKAEVIVSRGPNPLNIGVKK